LVSPANLPLISRLELEHLVTRLDADGEVARLERGGLRVPPNLARVRVRVRVRVRARVRAGFGSAGAAVERLRISKAGGTMSIL